MAEEYDELELSRLRENALKSRPAQHHHSYSSSSRNQDFLLPLPTPSQPLLATPHYRIPLPIPPSSRPPPPSSHPPRHPPSHPPRSSRPQTRPTSHNSHPLPSHSSKSSSRSSSSSSSSYSSYSKEEGASRSGSSRSSRSVSAQSGSSYSSYSHSPPPAHSPHYRRGRRGSPSPQRGPYVPNSPRQPRMSQRKPRSSSPPHHRRHHFSPPPSPPLPPRRHSPYFPRKQSPSYSRKDYPSPRRRSPRRPSPRRPSPRREDDGWRHSLHPLPPRRPSPRRMSPRRPSPRRMSPRRPSPRRMSPRRPSPRRMSPRRPSPRRMSPRRPSPRRMLPRRPSPRRHVLPPRADDVVYYGGRRSLSQERHRLVSPPPRLRSPPPPPPGRISPRRVRERRNLSPPPPRARGMTPPPGRIMRDRSPRLRRNPSPRRPSPRRPREPSPRRERERRASLRRDIENDKRLRLASGSERLVETRDEMRGGRGGGDGGRKRKRSLHGETLPSKQHKTEEDLLLEDEVLVDKMEKSSGLTGLDPLDEELDYDESMEDIERYLHEDEQSDTVVTLKSEVRKKPTLPEKDQSPLPPSTPPETNGENETLPHQEEMRTGEGDESRVVLMEDEEEEGQLDPSDSDTPNDGYPQQELSETLDGIARGLEEGAENNREDHGAEVRIVRQEIGLSGEEEYSLMGGEALISEEQAPPKTDTPPPPDSGSEDASAPGLISSPIRLTPERDANGSSGRKSLTSRSRKLIKDHASENDGDDNRLPVKERLYISKQDIERKKEASDYRQQHKISSTLESRLGPSPNDKKPLNRGRRNRRKGQKREVKGSAIEIAQAFRREQERKNQGEGILDEQELRKGQRFAKMLNEHQTRPDNNRLSRRDEDLDKRINRIRSNNQKQLERDKEIRKDRQLHG